MGKNQTYNGKISLSRIEFGLYLGVQCLFAVEILLSSALLSVKLISFHRLIKTRRLNIDLRY